VLGDLARRRAGAGELVSHLPVERRPRGQRQVVVQRLPHDVVPVGQPLLALDEDASGDRVVEHTDQGRDRFRQHVGQLRHGEARPQDRGDPQGLDRPLRQNAQPVHHGQADRERGSRLDDVDGPGVGIDLQGVDPVRHPHQLLEVEGVAACGLQLPGEVGADPGAQQLLDQAQGLRVVERAEPEAVGALTVEAVQQFRELLAPGCGPGGAAEEEAELAHAAARRCSV